MKRKYSQTLLWKLHDLIRTAKEEIGEELGEEKVYAMLNAFDPSVKRQLFIQILIGDLNGDLRIKITNSSNRKKIEAIKGVRAVAHLGLKEAKEVIDIADTGRISVIKGCWNAEDYKKLQEYLMDTGYEVI